MATTELGISEIQLAEAEGRAKRRRLAIPLISRVQCTKAELAITFATGVSLRVPTHLIQGLADAPASALRDVEISPIGTGLHFPAIDADIYLPGLLKGIFGSPAWMRQVAAEMGSKGGQSTSSKKRSAAQRNGALGGRPRMQSA